MSIYFDAVRNGTAPHYSAQEAAAWAPDARDQSEWTGRLAEGRTWIAESDAGAQGFITLAPEAHLDLFFVRPTARPMGVAAALYDTLLAAAREDRHSALTTHASHLARRFLDRRGWTVEAEEQSLRHGILLTRFRMRLRIAA